MGETRNSAPFFWAFSGARKANGWFTLMRTINGVYSLRRRFGAFEPDAVASMASMRLQCEQMRGKQANVFCCNFSLRTMRILFWVRPACQLACTLIPWQRTVSNLTASVVVIVGATSVLCIRVG